MSTDASKNTQSNPMTTGLPSCLTPCEPFDDWNHCVDAEIHKIASGFSRQFGVPLQVAVSCVLSAAAQYLGGSISFELPHRRVAPPFSLLVISPDIDPVWPQVPLRFFREELEEYLHHQFALDEAERGGSEKGLKMAVDPSERLKAAQANARHHLAGNVLDRVYRESVAAPFPISHLDWHITLGTPREGLLRAMKKLTPSSKLYLRDTLQGGGPSSSVSGSNFGSDSSFLWHLPERQAKAFFRQAPWMRRIPFLFLRSEVASFPNLDSDGSAVTALGKIGRRFFGERVSRAARPLHVKLTSAVGKPVMQFLQEAQTGNVTTDSPMPLTWVAELGLKFALIRMRFREVSEPDPFTVQAGLELAKHLARDHFQNLAAWLPGPRTESAEFAELTPVERRAYLLIVENPGITKADLRRRIRNLSATGRDEIVVRLLAMGLIRRAGEGLQQNAT
jgi:hypothetical protein